MRIVAAVEDGVSKAAVTTSFLHHAARREPGSLPGADIADLSPGRRG